MKLAPVLHPGHEQDWLDDGTPHVQIDSRSDGDATLVYVTGNLDAVGGEQLLDYCANQVDPDHSVALDLVQVHFIDSTGLSALLRIVGALRAQGIEATVVRASGRVLNLFDLTGLRSPLMQGDPVPSW